MFDYNVTNLKNTSEIPIGSWVNITSVKKIGQLMKNDSSPGTTEYGKYKVCNPELSRTAFKDYLSRYKEMVDKGGVYRAEAVAVTARFAGVGYGKEGC